MPQCLRCGAELPVNEDGGAPVLCDRCAGRATRRARIGMNSGTLREFPATTLLLAINVIVFAVMVVSGGSIMDFGGETLVTFGANYGPLTLGGEYWRLVTAGFVHGGLLHIAFNMWCLWSLGQLSERLFGSWITFAVYILTGVAGAMLSVGWNPARLEVGASGAIFGIAGAILSGIKFGNVSVSSWQKRQIFSSLIFFVGFNLLFGIAPGIDNMCHLGGLISGLIFGIPLATASASGKKSYEWATMILAALVLAGVGAQVVKARAPQGHFVRSPNLVRQAQADMESGDFSHAAPLLEKAAEANPDNAELQALLGYAYEKNNERDKAIAAYQRALKLNPNFSEVKKQLEGLQDSSPPSDK